MMWIFRAKVNYIHSATKVDMNFDLGFKIKYRQDITLNEYQVPPELEEKAKSCLILLIGGHRVLVRVDKSDKGELWNGRVYLYQSIAMDGVYEILSDRRIPCLNRIMSKMADVKYDPEYLAKFIDKGKAPEIPE